MNRHSSCERKSQPEKNQSVCFFFIPAADVGRSCLLPQGQIRELEETALKSEVLPSGVGSSFIIILEIQETNLDHFLKENDYSRVFSKDDSTRKGLS